MFLLLISILLLSWTCYSIMTLLANLQRAHAIGLPVKVLPVSPMNILWAVSEPVVFGIIDRLPFKLGNVSRYGRRAWHFQEKATSHLELGDAFSIVSPGEIFIYISDPQAIDDIFARRADFARPLEIYQMLAVYGSNVSTVGWADWQRQRKIVGASFNENTNKLVWAESLTQARDMLSAWTQAGMSGAHGTAQDTRTLSLDVLAAAGFKKSYKFRAFSEPVGDENPARSYRESLKTVMDNSIIMMVAPPKLLSIPIMPKKYRHVGEATQAFKTYMMGMLDDERHLIATGKPGTGNLITSLIRNSEETRKSGSTDSKMLSVSEILGNIFVINFAGHDTTANTLAYAVLLLAAHPQVQEWVGEEIRALWKDQSIETLEYEKMFPRLKRCQAVLLETIRLYPPIMALPKFTHKLPQSLMINGKRRIIPPGTFVVPSLLAVQTHPKYWAPDPLEWRPSRWIAPGKASSRDTTTARLDKEEINVPVKGTYFPWSDGPQYCPGKKFAQVEFVAVVAVLFHKHRVHPLLYKDESIADAQARARAVCEYSEHVLLLRMRDGDAIRLVWEAVD